MEACGADVESAPSNEYPETLGHEDDWTVIVTGLEKPPVGLMERTEVVWPLPDATKRADGAGVPVRVKPGTG